MQRIYLSLFIIILTGCNPLALLKNQFSNFTKSCQSPLIQVNADFSSGNMAYCSFIDEQTVEIQLKPESTPINHSPWYAIRLIPKIPKITKKIKVVFNYETHPHRYIPKISVDNIHWEPIDNSQITIEKSGFRVSISLSITDKPIILSAQELLTHNKYQTWVQQQIKKSFVHANIFGKSVENRPLYSITSNATLPYAKTIMLVGRQHPPEVTGGLAMFSFMNELLADSNVAQQFRQKFNLIMIPELNPDGVEHGNWRFNQNGIDLNRDWGTFKQPEIKAVKTIIDNIKKPGMALFLDFHSMDKNTFYTQPDGQDGTSYNFTKQWLERTKNNLTNYSFTQKGANHPEVNNSKTYNHQRFNIPAITYEVGDETNRDDIKRSAKLFAQEMMLILLANE